MKKITCLIILLVLLLTGCSDKQTVSQEKTDKVVSNTEEITDEQNSGYSNQSNKKEDKEEDKEEVKNEEIKPNLSDVKEKYSRQYEAEHIFQDLYVPAKCFLVGEKSIVEVISLGEVDNVTVISQTSVERVEQSTVIDCAIVTVFDKTGKSVSINLSSEEAEKLIGLIKNK